MFRPPAKIDPSVSTSIRAARLISEKLSLLADIRTIAKLYLKIGGNPNLSWKNTTPAETIGSLIIKAIENTIRKHIPKPDGFLTLDIDIEKNDFDPEPEFSLYLIVITESEKQLELAYLKTIREKRGREVHNLVLNTIRTVLRSPYIPYTDLDMIYGLSEPYYFDAQDEDDTYKAELKNLTLDLDEFKKLFPATRTGYKALIRHLKNRYRRLKKSLNPTYRKWIEKALKIIDTANKLQLDTGLWREGNTMGEERPCISNSYTVYLRSERHYMDYYYEYLNDYVGNYGSPAEIIRIESLESLKSISPYICNLKLLAELFDEFYGLEKEMRQSHV